MKVKLEQRWIKCLMRLPESGMGYQRVDLSLADGREVKDVLVFNAEELEVSEKLASSQIKDIRPHRN